MAHVFSKNAKARLKRIHQLSRSINGKTAQAHEKKLLALMAEHVLEIRALHRMKNKHFLIETGDLAILCLELLQENHKDFNDIFTICFDRYDRKLLQLKEKRLK